MFELREGLLREALGVLHRCGNERDECVALFTGATDGAADTFLHPPHDAGRHGYEIDEAWMHQLWVDLARQGRRVLAQIHTHPREAFHSRTDDAYPAVHVSGFVTLVVADFARPPVNLDRMHASVLTPSGWRRSTLRNEVRLV